MIKRNPCRIKGADKETEHSRPVATVAQVYALADAIPPRFRVLVLLGAFTSLRWGELVNLRRVNVFLFTSVFSLSCGSWLPAGTHGRRIARPRSPNAPALERQPAPARRREQ